MSAKPAPPAPVSQSNNARRTWVILGVVVLALAGLGAAIFFSIVALFKSSDVYQLALARVNANVEATALLGLPIEPGFPMGSIRVSGPSGDAQLSIPVRGSKGKGTIYLQATRQMGTWTFERIQLEIDGSDGRIDLDPFLKGKGRAV